MRFKVRVGLIDEFCTGKPYTADLIPDFVQCAVRGFGARRASTARRSARCSKI